MTAVLNHLWQSTVFAGVAALLALALRKNHARTRYWIWMAASLKFLIPFSLLVSVGNRVEWRAAPAIAAQPAIAFAMDEISRPFPVTQIETARVPAAHAVMPTVLIAIWIAGCAIVLISWLRRWLRVRASLRRAIPVQIEFPIKVMSSPALIEPGIFGIFRPVLLLPDGIAGRLTPAQLHSILAHELCHVQRRDNLAAVIHMLVEAAFWFHPLVWWIGARLIEERERACDEEVLLQGSEPGVYAESILQVCKFYLESPLECAAGVTGSDLKKRIESIMNARFGRGLTPLRKLLLVAASLSAIAGPLIFGALTAPRIRAQSQDGPALSFEVASIKPSPADAGERELSRTPGMRLTASNATLKMLILLGYQVMPNQLSGGPEWLSTDGFDIEAKPENPSTTQEQFFQMVQTMLKVRFHLKTHIETKELPTYELVVDKRGPKLKESKDSKEQATMTSNYGLLTGVRATMPMFVKALSKRLDRQVVDKTGLTGTYTFKLAFTPEQKGSDPDRAPPPGDHPSIFTALPEQLGLALKASKGPVQILVIDRAEKPTDNAAEQAPEKPAPKFEVASIHRSDPEHVGFQAYFLPGGKFTAMTAPLKNLVGFAYQLREHQVTGGPGWIDSEPFDISAKADAPASDDDLHRMVQALLADRFQLKFHRETKEQPVYTLVLAGKVAKTGAKLQEVKTAGRGVGIGMLGRLNGNGADMDTLASVLSTRLGRSVKNQTGLQGFYDFVLSWTPDEAQPDTPGPSLFTALQEQLGLKLEAGKGPVDIIVIDRAEKPTEN